MKPRDNFGRSMGRPNFILDSVGLLGSRKSFVLIILSILISVCSTKDSDFDCSPPVWFRCHNGLCISSHYRCDNENNCEDMSDEHDCHNYQYTPPPANCTKSEWLCLDNVCIPNAWVCDGKVDCLDGSDETLGCSTKIKCDGFECKNRQCIPIEWLCDGNKDCTDGSDEADCRISVHPEDCNEENGFFLCHDNVTCILLEQLCNNKSDCSDGSDEGGYCGTDLCATAGCSHKCLIEPRGARCLCPKGYELVGKACNDIDECKIYGKCSQKCINLEGSYSCDCEKGFQLDHNNSTCKVEGIDAMLLFATRREIQGLYLDSKILFPVQRKLKQCIGVAYDGDKVYWTNIEHGEESILGSDIDGKNIKPVVTSGLHLPEELTVDWLGKNLYFTDAEEHHIGVCSLNGDVCTILVNEDVDSPRGIVVIPQEGYLFWTDWGKKPMVARSGMDGSKPKPFVDSDIKWPNGLALDYPARRLYWIDAKILVIESIKLDGTDRRTILKGIMKHPYSIAVFEDLIYWSDWEGREIRSCNKFTGKDRKILLVEDKLIFSVKIYHSALQPKVDNPCRLSQCSHMCLIAPNGGYKCACPPEKQLSTDEHHCKDLGNNPSVLFVGVGQTLKRIKYKILGKLEITELPLRTIHNIDSITYSPISESVIIADNARKQIVKLDLKTLDMVTLISGQLGKVEGMDFDYLGNNIYWCDSERKMVEVMSMASHERGVILKDLAGERPIDLVVIPDEGVMFISLLGVDNRAFIDRFSMTGKGRVHVVHESLGEEGLPLAYDSELKRVFWADPSTHRIESTSVDGLDRHVWKTSLPESPVDLTVLGSRIFFTGFYSMYLHWSNKFSPDKIIERHRLDDDESFPVMKLATMITLREWDHPCHHNNGDCSHLCLVSSKKMECFCPIGMLLGKDNKTCVLPTHCTREEYLCKTDKKCIPKKWRCDDKKDCPSGEDEQRCRRTCSSKEFTCDDGQCIAKEAHCDHHYDCDDKSDERNCYKDICDPEKQFQCLSGECIDIQWKCDYVKDCMDGSDEVCDRESCTPGQTFQCKSGSCIPSTWECDSEIDCPDASDEHDQCKKTKCNSKEFTCSNGNCVDRRLVCNGQDNCGDGSDETCEEKPITTTEYPECFHGYFRCSSDMYICLPDSARCNGTAECPTYEDEDDCGCRKGEYQCKNGRCILKQWVCDRVDDCDDGSDEDHCTYGHTQPSGRNHTTASEGLIVSPIAEPCDQFLCGSGECLPYSMVCNSISNCADHSDEGGRCENACKENPCSSICHETPSGPACSCLEGFKLSGDGKNCEDINECEYGEGHGPCSQFCTNIEGSFRCSCNQGYLLRTDRVSCKAEGSSLEFVYVTDGDIRKASHDVSVIDVLLSNSGKLISGLDVHVEENYVYWTSELEGTLNRLSIKTGKKTNITNLIFPSKLTVDWRTGNIYFVEKKRNPSIKVCNMNENKCVTLKNFTSSEAITSLVTEPNLGLLVWSQFMHSMLDSPRSEIWKLGLDGSQMSKDKPFVSGDMHLVSGLAIDHVLKRLYWVDQRLQTLSSIDLDGGDRKILLRKHVHHPIGLSVFEDYIYWSTAGSGRITKCRRFHPITCESLDIRAFDIQHFTIMQQSRQIKEDNPCFNHPCDKLCVLGPVRERCLCDDGQTTAIGRLCNGNLAKIQPGLAAVSNGNDYEGSIENGGSNVTGIVIAVLIITLIMGGCYYHYRRKSGSGVFDVRMHFQNDTYGIPTSDGTFSKADSLVPGQHQYDNPTFKTDTPDCKVAVEAPQPGQFARRKPLVRKKATINASSINANTPSYNNFEDSEEENISDSYTTKLVKAMEK